MKVNKLIKAFSNAINGIRFCYRNEFNFRIHLVAILGVIIFSFITGISETECLIVTGCCMLVVVFEMMNTALEGICDQITSDFHPKIKIIKDISAGAVLVSAIGSCIIGCIIFIPKIF